MNSRCQVGGERGDDVELAGRQSSNVFHVEGHQRRLDDDLDLNVGRVAHDRGPAGQLLRMDERDGSLPAVRDGRENSGQPLLDHKRAIRALRVKRNRAAAAPPSSSPRGHAVD